RNCRKDCMKVTPASVSYSRMHMPKILLSLLLACAMFSAAWAAEARIVARFVPEAGQIADAAILGTDHIALLYPQDGRIADYSMEGRLMQHIIREGGAELEFLPTACTEGPDRSI